MMLLPESQDNTKIKVLFLIYFASIWNSTKSVYEAMKQDNDFEPIIILLPNKQASQKMDYEDGLIEFFASQSIDVILAVKGNEYLDLKTLHPDIIFIQTPYYAGVSLYDYKVIETYARIAYIPYGVMTAKLQSSQYNLQFHKACWKIFLESQKHKEMALTYSTIQAKNTVVTGYPKFDLYPKESPLVEKESAWKISKKENPSIKRILWTPHWTIGKKLSYSTFFTYYPFFLDFAKKNPNIEIILKPHPLLWKELIDAHNYTQNDIDTLIYDFNTLPNASVYTDGEYIDLFFSSDALINDSISFLAEYLLTHKPLLFLDSQKHIGFNEFGNELMKNIYISKNEQETLSFIDEVVIKEKDSMYSKRIHAIQDLFYLPEEGAANIILKTIKQELIRDRIQKRKQKKYFKKLQDMISNFWKTLTLEEYINKFLHFLPQQKEFITKYILSQLNSSSTILDMGCGNGTLDFYISPFVKSIDAYDISTPLLENAKEYALNSSLSNISFYNEDILTLQNKNEYTLVNLAEITRYVINDNELHALFLTIKERLCANGIFFLSDIYTTEDVFSVTHNTHLAIYRNAQKIVDYLERAGFSISQYIPLPIQNINEYPCYFIQFLATNSQRKNT